MRTAFQRLSHVLGGDACSECFADRRPPFFTLFQQQFLLILLLLLLLVDIVIGLRNRESSKPSATSPRFDDGVRRKPASNSPVVDEQQLVTAYSSRVSELHAQREEVARLNRLLNALFISAAAAKSSPRSATTPAQTPEKDARATFPAATQVGHVPDDILEPGTSPHICQRAGGSVDRQREDVVASARMAATCASLQPQSEPRRTFPQSRSSPSRPSSSIKPNLSTQQALSFLRPWRSRASEAPSPSAASPLAASPPMSEAASMRVLRV